jgi:hypothetical protein
MLATFSSTARDEVELEVLTDHLLAVVNEMIQPAHASLWLMRSGDERKEEEKKDWTDLGRATVRADLPLD